MAILQWVYVAVPVAAALLDAVLCYWIYTRHGEVQGARWFALSLGAGALWMCTNALVFLVSAPSWQWLFATLSTKLSVASFLAWTVFASRYSSSEFHTSLPARLSFGFVGLTLLVPTFLDPFHRLFYSQRRFLTEPFPHVVTEPTALYLAATAVVTCLSAYGLYALVRYLLSTPRDSGWQLVALVAGSLAFALAIALGNAGVFPIEGPANAVFGAPVFTLLVTVALFRFRLFDIQPVARNAVVEELKDPVLVLDGDRRVVDYNPASTAVWPGLDEDVARPVAEVCPEVAEELPDGDPVETDGQLSLPVDGTRRHYSLNVSAVDGGEGTARLYSVLLRDVTDLERSRWLLARQNERLDQVAATISHDLRNPIAVADGNAEILLDLLADEEPDLGTARERAERIREANGRMLDIIDDVLLLAREGKSVEETEPVSLSDVAREAWGNVATGDATLTVAGDRSLAADRSKLLTLFENLFRNAVEHAGEAVAVTVEPTADGFAVADDGPGVPPGDADEVFEYGYTTADDGTGLGLSIVRTLAESHGWSVALDTDHDGARFVVRNVDSPAGSGSDSGAGSDSAPPTTADSGGVAPTAEDCDAGD